MKIRCDRNELFDRLQSVAGIATAAGTAKPILQNCLLSDSPRGLGITVTDLDLSARLFIEHSDVDEPGTLALPAARLLSLVREIPASTLLLESDPSERGALLHAESYEVRLLGEDWQEFPEVKAFDAAESLEIHREKFVEMLRRVGVAAGRDSSRYQLLGVYFEVAKDKIEMVATDGKRLAMDWMRVDNPSDLALSGIIPNRAVDTLGKVLSHGPDVFRLVSSETEIQVSFEHGELFAKLIEGAFPEYRAAIPRESTTRVTARRGELISAAKSASLVTDKDTSTVLFRFSEGEVCLESRASNVGESRIKVAAQVDGEALEIRFNPVYFIDGLRTIQDEDVRMEFSGAKLPGAICGAEHYRHYLMPLVVKT